MRAGGLLVEYGGGIDDEGRKPRRSARELARAVEGGRDVGAALRHLDGHGSEPGAQGVAEALARFLVARCDSHHAGWRVVRQVVVDSAADAPWERCARRAIPLVSEDLLRLAGDRGRTPLARAQHIAAQRRAEQIAVHVDQAVVLADLGLECSAGTPERWRVALTCAVRARSASRSPARLTARFARDPAQVRAFVLTRDRSGKLSAPARTRAAKRAVC